MSSPPSLVHFETEALDLKSAWASIFRGRSLAEIEADLPNQLLTSCGRSAFLPILMMARKRGILENKNSPILFPQWLCLSMVQMTRKYAAPVLDPKIPVKMALVYHQYGFPSKMDEILDHADRKKITIVEDCANLWEGEDSKGRKLGEMGWASIYSLSKVFPLLWGGCLKSNDPELLSFAKELRAKSTHYNWIRWGLEATRYWTDHARPRNPKLASNLTLMLYAVAEYTQMPSLWMAREFDRQLKNGSLQQRKRNYLRFRKNLADVEIFKDLEVNNVNPYVIPVFSTRERLTNLSKKLEAEGYLSGIYNFDVNRNVFNPKFELCAWVPTHQGLTISQMDDLSQLVRQELT